MTEHSHEEGAVQGLPEPPPPTLLTLAFTADGRSAVNYVIDPEKAVQVLREVADSIEAEITQHHAETTAEEEERRDAEGG
jgi:hypothetical protein